MKTMAANSQAFQEADIIRFILKAVLLKIIPASSLQYLIKLFQLWQRHKSSSISRG